MAQEPIKLNKILAEWASADDTDPWHCAWCADATPPDDRPCPIHQPSLFDGPTDCPTCGGTWDDDQNVCWNCSDDAGSPDHGVTAYVLDNNGIVHYNTTPMADERTAVEAALNTHEGNAQ